VVKNPAEIEKMREARGLTTKVLEALDAYIRPGVSTFEIDHFCERFIIDTLNARPVRGSMNPLIR